MRYLILNFTGLCIAWLMPGLCRGQENHLPEMHLSAPITVDSLGAAQGASFSNGKLYLYGDRELGVIREYIVTGNSLRYTGVELKLAKNNKDLINHPTGLFNDPSVGTFIGNTTVLDKKKNIWKAQIFFIQWDSLYKYHTLDKAVLNCIEDDACIQGSRPEYVEYDGKKYLATADYGNNGNEVRLYNPDRLKTAKRTSEAGVLAYKFTCGPWVQNMHWVREKDILILIQNRSDGRNWRFTLLDLKKSVLAGKQVIIKQVNFDIPDELEGFTLFDTLDQGIAVSSSSKNNMVMVKLSW